MSSHISEPSSPSSIPSPVSGPSRKRPRSEMSSEERKEARAHRNRIAAQNSRDRRKAQFTYLERRVAELEEENKRLRAGLPPSEPQQDSVKDRENQELRARIASLERGLEAVVKAFSGQEAAPVIPTAEASKLPESSPASTTTSISAVSTSTSTPSCPPTDSTQSTVPSQTMSFPLSPTPSHNSDTPEFTFTSTTSPVSSPLPLPTSESELESQSTRHLARMATTRPRVALQRPVPVDDATMETLFREILCESRSTSPSPETRSESVPALDLFNSTGQTQGSPETAPTGTKEVKEETEVEMLGLDMNMTGVAGLNMDMDVGLGTEGTSSLFGFGNTQTIESTSGGFTATWLDGFGSGSVFDYTTLLEGLDVVPAMQTDSSATPVMPMSLGSSGVQVV
ncbi:x-box binding protein 1 [Moniliophthora roreri MCA 2997]|uniref:X-box-binding protein 1 n=1 Tax=Moniliophthora roreri (strain MCA 2997) TaxID=1381753 RepID=V2XNE7_MONRO|nr:x-box binding protein 1 [Moniliophthora roreri MCA 2997]